MKTFIYFSQVEWRTFQAEELPVKPPAFNFLNRESHHTIQYESEIAALKAKSLKVGNVDVIPRVGNDGFPIFERTGTIHQWPGTVEVKEELEYPIDHTSYPPYIEVAILKLPNP